MRRALEDLLALLLGDAAEHGKALPFLLQLLEVVQAMEDLLLGFIADRAGVVEDEVGLLFALHLRVALRDERADDFFRVVEVHLAAEGLDVKRLLRRNSQPSSDHQYIAGNGGCIRHGRPSEGNREKEWISPCPPFGQVKSGSTSPVASRSAARWPSAASSARNAR